MTPESSALISPQAETSCRLFGDASVSAACLPRCSAGTRAAFYRCQPSSKCEADALKADATAAVVVGSETFDCTGCVQRAREACRARVCPQEATAVFACRASGTNCNAQTTALNLCLQANPLRWEACSLSTEVSCFAR